MDDHLDTAESLAVLLRDMGHVVEFAVNGAAALKLAASFSPDVILLDLMLPDIDGLALAQKLRSLELPRPRMIAMTGRSGAEWRERSLQAGCDAFLAKPLDLCAVERLLR
ncbi:MAG: response regulator [Betaproteobacteria bacterium]|nr:response regulator [Betaproteobacteria bacterium]